MQVNLSEVLIDLSKLRCTAGGFCECVTVAIARVNAPARASREQTSKPACADPIALAVKWKLSVFASLHRMRTGM